MSSATAASIELRTLSLDEVEQVSGAAKKATYLIVEKCRDVKQPDGSVVEKCTTVVERPL